MEQLAGRSQPGPFRFAVVVVAVVAVLGVVRLIASGSGQDTHAARLGASAAAPMTTGPPPPAASEAPPRVPVTSLRLPVTSCGEVADLQLHGPLVRLRAASQQPDPLADLTFTGCGGAGEVLVTPDGDALLSRADVSAAASYTECAESMREGTVSRLVIGVGTTFCALQRAGTAPQFGGQTMARVTVTGIDASGVVTVHLEGWSA